MELNKMQVMIATIIIIITHLKKDQGKIAVSTEKTFLMSSF